MNLSRRNFIKLGSALAATSLVGSGAYQLGSSVNTTEKLITTNHILQLKHIPANFLNFKIAFLSDIHLGPYLPESLLQQALNIVNEQGADILILGGDHLHIPSSLLSKIFGFNRNPDYAYGKPRQRAKKIIDRLLFLLTSINCPHGIIAIAGNHDNSNAYHYIKNAFEKAGIRYLVNESIVLKSGNDELELVGVDDYWTGVPTLPRSNQKKNRIRILCSHNPDFASTLFENENHYFDIALAGHTHAGQFRTAGGTALICNVYDRRYIHGFNQYSNTPILVSAGLGTVEIPYRINCPPEINFLTISEQHA